jgi:hypothetical protein
MLVVPEVEDHHLNKFHIWGKILKGKQEKELI